MGKGAPYGTPSGFTVTSLADEYTSLNQINFSFHRADKVKNSFFMKNRVSASVGNFFLQQGCE